MPPLPKVDKKLALLQRARLAVTEPDQLRLIDSPVWLGAVKCG